MMNTTRTEAADKNKNLAFPKVNGNKLKTSHQKSKGEE